MRWDSHNDRNGISGRSPSPKGRKAIRRPFWLQFEYRQVIATHRSGGLERVRATCLSKNEALFAAMRAITP
jgi:hypothetical protein